MDRPSRDERADQDGGLQFIGHGLRADGSPQRTFVSVSQQRAGRLVILWRLRRIIAAQSRARPRWSCPGTIDCTSRSERPIESSSGASPPRILEKKVNQALAALAAGASVDSLYWV
jgi:hypothetical protein